MCSKYLNVSLLNSENNYSSKETQQTISGSWQVIPLIVVQLLSLIHVSSSMHVPPFASHDLELSLNVLSLGWQPVIKNKTTINPIIKIIFVFIIN